MLQCACVLCLTLCVNVCVCVCELCVWCLTLCVGVCVGGGGELVLTKDKLHFADKFTTL